MIFEQFLKQFSKLPLYSFCFYLKVIIMLHFSWLPSSTNHEMISYPNLPLTHYTPPPPRRKRSVLQNWHSNNFHRVKAECQYCHILWTFISTLDIPHKWGTSVKTDQQAEGRTPCQTRTQSLKWHDQLTSKAHISCDKLMPICHPSFTLNKKQCHCSV